MELGHLRRRPKERVFSIAKRYVKCGHVGYVDWVICGCGQCRFLQGPEIPERQLYREPPEAFLEADNMEVRLKSK